MKSIEELRKEYPQDDFCGTEFKTPKGGVLTVVGISGKDKWGSKICACHCSICHVDEVMFPELFLSPKQCLKRGQLPCGCSKAHKYKDNQYRIRIKRIHPDYTIVSNNNIESTGTYVRVRCNIDGYEWDACVNNLLNGKGCVKCANRDLSISMKINDPITRLISSCEKIGIEFLSLVGDEYETCLTTRVNVRCKCGNEWSPVYSSIVHETTGCSACADYGFNPSKVATFYFTIWQKNDHKFIKYGIARNFNQRIKKHKRDTDYELVYQWTPEFKDGKIPQEIEQACDEYRNKTVGNSGYVSKEDFLAYTETLPITAYDDLTEIIASHCIARPKPLELI